MSKSFDTIDIQTLIRKLLQTNILGTIIMFIANYIMGRKTYTTYRCHTSRRNLKLAFHKAASFHPHYLTSTPQTCHNPMHRFRAWPMQMTSTSHSHNTSTSTAKQYIQPYLQKVFACTKQNNLILNPDKTTCTLFTPDPAEYTSNLDLKINNTALPMASTQRFWVLT